MNRHQIILHLSGLGSFDVVGIHPRLFVETFECSPFNEEEVYLWKVNESLSTSTIFIKGIVQTYATDTEEAYRGPRSNYF